jgi:hypothetical protein
MDGATRANLDNIHSPDRDQQGRAFSALLTATEQPVDWAYEAWDGLLADLRDPDNHVRAIAAQVLCNLARSDPQARILKDFDALLNVTRDERFVTARHTMQAIWKVGAAGEPQRRRLVEGLSGRFHECIAEKNCALIRYDILQSLRNLYDQAPDESLRTTALALIETEEDLKYRKKYATLWRKS